MAGAGRLEHVHDALSAEMYACLEALKAYSDQGMLRVLIESDCSILVSAMKKSGYEYSPVGVLIEEAKSFIMLNFVNVEFLFIPRSCNACADELARVGFTRDPDWPGLWFDPFPESVMPLLARDLAGSAVDE
jgi:ribonuclease HI